MADHNPLHIGILLETDDSWLGGVYYFQNLVKALRRLDEDRQAVRISVLSRRVLPELQVGGVRQVPIPPRSSIPLARRLLWRAMKALGRNADPIIENIVGENGIDFLYPYPGRSRRKAFSSAAWIFDFQHKYLPDFFSTEEIRQRDRMFAGIAESAPCIVVSSQSAAADFRRYFPGYSRKVRVLRFRTCIDELSPVSEVAKSVRKYHLPEKFFMVCNQFWQHKNHLRVLESVADLEKRGITIYVVMTGHMHDYRRPQFQDEILQTIHHYGIHENIFLVGRIPKQDYFCLMRAAVAVLQPSLFEGWSSVVEDARALGKPIVLSDIPVHREQNPPGAHYFNALSSAELADTLASLVGTAGPGPNLRAEAIAGLENRKAVLEFAESFRGIAETSRKTQNVGKGTRAT